MSNQSGHYEYLPAGNLISHITHKRTGKTPEEYHAEKTFPLLGITPADYEWYKNFDDVNLGFHGLKMNVRSASKMGMLYLQGGMANEDDRIIDESWIERTYTPGDTSEGVTPFGYMWWLETDYPPVFCTYGFLGQRVCLNYRTNRVIATFSEQLDFVIAYNGSDPAQPWPTDKLVNLFVFEEPSELVDCGADYPPDSSASSDAFRFDYAIGLALLLAGLLAKMFL